MSTEPDSLYYGDAKRKELHSHVQPLLKREDENSDGNHVINYMWYFYAGVASLMLGTKMMLITYVKCAKIWIFFIEHMAIWITWLIVISIYYQYLKYKHVSTKAMKESYHFDFELFSNKRQAICGLISGSLNAIGNVFIIFSMKHAYAAGASPSTMTAIVMFNVLLILVAGITLFNEVHKPMKYVGGFIVLISLVLITTQRQFESREKYSRHQNLDFDMALFYACLTAVAWGGTAISWKYATYYYGADSVEFGTVAMTLSGILGSTSIVYLYFSQTDMQLGDGFSLNHAIFFCSLWGIFTALAWFMLFKAISIGSAEIAQLITNTKVLVQMVEEFAILRISPSTVALIGMWGVFIGIVIMLLTGEKQNLSHNQVMETDQETQGYDMDQLDKSSSRKQLT